MKMAIAWRFASLFFFFLEITSVCDEVVNHRKGLYILFLDMVFIVLCATFWELVDSARSPATAQEPKEKQ